MSFPQDTPCVSGTVYENFTYQCGISYNNVETRGEGEASTNPATNQECLYGCTGACVGVTSDYNTCIFVYLGSTFAVSSDDDDNAMVNGGGSKRTWSAFRSSGENAIAEPIVGQSVTAEATTGAPANPSSTTSSSTGGTSSLSTGGAGAMQSASTSTTITSSTTASSSTGSSPSSSSATGSSAGSLSNNPSAAGEDGGGGGSDVGAIAGAAVGCFIGGIIVSLLAIFLYRHYRRRQNPRSSSSNALLGARVEKPSPSSTSSTTTGHPWEAYFRLPYDDQRLATGVHTLLSQISQHVDNYYGNGGSFSAAEFDRARGFLNVVDSGRLQTPLEQLMPEAGNVLPAIKHSFAWFILGKLTPSAAPEEETLLPVEYGRLPPRLAGGERDDATSQAYRYWRVLTAYLMYPKATASPTQLGSAGTQTIDVLTGAFAPWAKSSKAGQEHLASVLKSATDTGLMIYSQSSSFVFEWDVLKGNDGTLVVVSPAFVKSADEYGRVLGRQQVLVKPQVESI